MVISDLFKLWDKNELTIALNHFYGYKREELLLNPNRELKPDELEKMLDLIEKRKKHIPLQYILGKWWFYDIEVEVEEGVLIPRPETEILVEKAIALTKPGMKILEIGTGTGIIAISLAKHTVAEIIAVDISERCIDLSNRNVSLNNISGIDFRKSDLYEAVEGLKFDMIVSNPPYISENERDKLEKELSYEPENALFSGDDGLDIIREIIYKAVYYLNKKGIIIIEIGFDQGEAVRDLLKNSNFTGIELIKDYNGLDRVVVGRLAG
ncbi:peptide chain release factor N(5)-glutamine methyltransferase [Microaceticoccus formicicus]|uniref:peptide chain release factor N(5)-glutamine methyltransferase n=1 Tax=Microaceticoccus formicicus TaxID=3118105 RepID=UPI003CD049CA|nr:peptide chain release factor N(5)-glutamine methyltransferase [Peptoniphilaceae bacterium AMB_02]